MMLTGYEFKLTAPQSLTKGLYIRNIILLMPNLEKNDGLSLWNVG